MSKVSARVAASTSMQPSRRWNSSARTADVRATGRRRSRVERRARGRKKSRKSAARGFNPYHKWFGIPAEERPVNHYRLLGIKPFEDDPDVIANAVDQRMMLVKTFSTGKHARTAEAMLNRLATVRVRLLNVEIKAAYDARLRKQLKSQSAGRAAASVPTPPPVRHRKSPVRQTAKRNRESTATDIGRTNLRFVAALRDVRATIADAVGLNESLPTVSVVVGLLLGTVVVLSLLILSQATGSVGNLGDNQALVRQADTDDAELEAAMLSSDLEQLTAVDNDENFAEVELVAGTDAATVEDLRSQVESEFSDIDAIIFEDMIYVLEELPETEIPLEHSIQRWDTFGVSTDTLQDLMVTVAEHNRRKFLAKAWGSRSKREAGQSGFSQATSSRGDCETRR